MFKQRMRTGGAGGILTCSLILHLMLSIACTSHFANGETRIYREQAPEKEYINTYRIEETGSGFFVSIISYLGEKLYIRKELWLDQSYATVKWRYENLIENIDISAIRDGNIIKLTGINRGQNVDHIYEIDSLPWKQQFPLDLERFVNSEQESIKFWAIGTNGPADMKIAQFIASKKERSPIRINGAETETVRVRVSFAGVLSLIWHGDAWHRLSDGRFLLFDSTSAPGYPPTKVELISERL